MGGKDKPDIAASGDANGDGCEKATLRMRNISVLNVFSFEANKASQEMVIFQY